MSEKHTQINFKVKIQVLEGVVFQTKVLFSRKCIRNFSCRVYNYMALKRNYPPNGNFFCITIHAIEITDRKIRWRVVIGQRL